MRTRDRLAVELRKVAEMVKEPQNKAAYEAFAVRAATGEFDDFGEMYDCPVTQLWTELMSAGFKKFADRVRDGEFDATSEESDEWARSPAAQEIAKGLPEAMRELFGLKLNN